MKKLLFISLITFAWCFLLITSCKKDKPQPEPCTTCHSVTEAKDYFAFKVGSWWVYEEETTLERDSVYITESAIDQGGYNFNVRMYSTYEDCYYHYWPSFIDNLQGCDASSPVSKRCLFVNKSQYQIPNYLYESQCFFINYKIGDFKYTSAGSLEQCENNRIVFENIYPEFTLLNDTYSKTIKIHEDCNIAAGEQPVNIYYAKGVGIIKKELMDSNRIWNLVNYHIEK